jgi:hypothetical protein
MKLLWIPHTGWHIPQRAHLFCRALAERHEVHVTDWVADFRTPRDLLSKRYLQNFFYRQYRDAKILVHGVPRFSPALFSQTLRDINRKLFERTIARIISKYTIDVVIGTFVVPPPHAPRIIFDLFDDNVAYWQTYGRVKSYAEEIDQVERAYLSAADAVVAASHVLFDLALKRGANCPVHLIPNGVELANFNNADGSGWRKKLGLDGHLVAVIGNHDKDVEMAKVIEMARGLADKNFQFIIAGRGSAIPRAKNRVREMDLKNVHFTGFLEPKNLPDFLAAMDIGLCPYQHSTGADASIPIRLLQYAAAGLPTVCPELVEAKRLAFDNVIIVEDQDRAFLDGLLHAAKKVKSRPVQIADYDLPLLVRRYEAVLQGLA